MSVPGRKTVSVTVPNTIWLLLETTAFAPIAVDWFTVTKVETSVFEPKNVFNVFEVLLYPARYPTATLSVPFIFEYNA